MPKPKRPSSPGDAPRSGGRIPAERVADLAAASRILAAQGVVDGFGHVSMRHPSAPDRYFMARALAPALVTPKDIVEYDLESSPCNAAGRPSFLERFIHGEIYKARPEVMAVVHSHSPSVIPFGLVDVPMRAMFHNAAFIAAGVPVFDIREKFGATDQLVSDAAKGAALSDIMGGHDIVLMRAHGSVACGASLETAVFRAVYTEVNARIQHWTVALGEGSPIAALEPEEARLADAVNQGAGVRAWQLWRTMVRNQVKW
jgi:ribulose-5-phosphate 4-epimerase/fuculose-1-phosphate aldolase